MMLSYRQPTFHVPHTSTCIIHTIGDIRDGDSISITSPIFSSINYVSGAINTSETFIVPVRIMSKQTITNDKPDGSFTGILVCDDDDTTSMYVRI
jgi:hypothetical protein